MSEDRPGEGALIARYFAPMAGPGAEGLRDDAASLSPRTGHDLVVSVDAIVAGIHFFSDDPPASVARKALGVNCSDLAAKGATPRGFLLTLALPDDWSEAWLGAFADGLCAASAAFACPLLGGDTTRSGGPLLLSVTVLGEVPHGTMVRRQGARPGDRLCVTGTIGDAALGLVVQREVRIGLDPEQSAQLIDRYRHPQPRLAIAEALRRHARAAMDVSDGLVGDLAKMLGDGVTARVRIADVPLSPAAERLLQAHPDLLATALTGGDDYEVLCAVPPSALEAFLADVRGAGMSATEIGEVTAGNGAARFVRSDGGVETFETTSFSHF